MGALLILELTIGVRTGAFAAAIWAHAALLAAFVVLWGGGVPLLPGANVYEQQRLIQWVILTALLPWVALRCGAAERGDDVVMLSVLTATPPSRVLAAQFLAHTCTVGLVVLSGLPFMVLAEQMSAVPLTRAFVDLLPPIALGSLASAAAICWTVLCRHALLAWLGASATTALVVMATTASLPPGAVPVALAVLGGIAAASCASRADISLRYLSEQRP